MANLFPFFTVANKEQEQTPGPLKFGKSWRFDFSKGDFYLTPTGSVVEADEEEAYRQWCQKALLTPRYRYVIYSRAYGSEYDELIGKGLSRGVMESEVKRMTKEALLVNPRTAEVTNFNFSWENNILYFTCEVISIRGEKVQVGNKVVVG